MPRRPRLTKEILSYFLRHPDAADDLEGVAHWRLLEEAIHRRIDETREALDWLVSEGLLSETRTAQGPLFSLNPVNREQAETLISSIDRGDRDRSDENGT
ncbi:MAG TPA: hypothetical protein VNG89_03435 [Vicinamibacterales bacterium]|nr:hypothetical protein [Vicinamibacterales bacterium]